MKKFAVLLVMTFLFLGILLKCRISNAAEVLIIEDDPGVSAFVMAVMARYPALHTRLATTRQEAYDLIANQVFDIILSDFDLPDGNGLEVWEKLKGHRPRFILMSGRQEWEFKDQPLFKEVEFLKKPFGVTQLKSIFGCSGYLQ